MAATEINRVTLGRVRFCNAGISRLIREAEDLIAHTLRRCRKPYVSFSGGKDSLVVLALVHKINPHVPVVWFDDELDFPETIDAMQVLKQAAPEQVIVMRHLGAPIKGPRTDGWFRTWSDRPFFRQPFCETHDVPSMQGPAWLADHGFDVCFLGTRAAENSRRFGHFVKRGSLYWTDTGRRCCPIAGWSDDDVWALIAGWQLPYNRAYATFEQYKIANSRWRVGPLPLVPRSTLELGWPDLLDRLEARYGRRWTD